MPKPRTILGPGILSAALVLSSCGSPNPRTATVVTTKAVGVTAAAVAPLSSAAAEASTIRSDLDGAGIEARSTGPADAA